jgi:hypothetical protein
MALGAIMAAPLIMLTPVTSRAGDRDPYYNAQPREKHDAVQEWFEARDIRGRQEFLERDRDLGGPNHRPLFGPDRPAGVPGNSVPLDEGTIFLLVAGLGLGVKMLYDRRKKVENSAI